MLETRRPKYDYFILKFEFEINIFFFLDLNVIRRLNTLKQDKLKILMKSWDCNFTFS